MAPSAKQGLPIRTAPHPPEEDGDSMFFHVPPPERVRTGEPFDLPVVVGVPYATIQATRSHPAYMFGLAVVESEDGTTVFEDLRDGMIEGQSTGSLQTLNPTPSSSSTASSAPAQENVLAFPDISIMKPGRYRLRILLGAVPIIGFEQPIAPPLLHSNVIEVDDEADVLSPTGRSTERSRILPMIRRGLCLPREEDDPFADAWD